MELTETTETPPITLAEAYQQLRQPFDPRLVELKPGATNQDKTRALAMPFVDMRAYFARLDRVVGPEGWSTEYTMSERGLICRLTILGTTKSGVGDFPTDPKDENPATSAEAQAFKRACAAFGLGRYLYALPLIWADYDQQKRQIVHPSGVIAAMYAQAGI